MANATEQLVPSINVDAGTWVLVTYGAIRFFGRVHALDFADPVVAYDKETKNLNKEFPVKDIVYSSAIAFKPVFDFFSPLRPVPIMGASGRPIMEGDGPLARPKMGFQRDPICTTRDFSTHPQTTIIRNGPGVIFDFFSQMHPDDKKKYQGFIEEAFQSALRQRTAEANITMPTADQTAAIERHGRS